MEEERREYAMEKGAFKMVYKDVRHSLTQYMILLWALLNQIVSYT